jgi:hypothetical protein
MCSNTIAHVINHKACNVYIYMQIYGFRFGRLTVMTLVMSTGAAAAGRQRAGESRGFMCAAAAETAD